MTETLDAACGDRYVAEMAALRQPAGVTLRVNTLKADRDAAAALKLRCMRIALEQIEADPVIEGVFLWKWFPGDRDHRDEFVLQYDAMRDVIRGAWGGELVDEVAARETASARSGTAQP